MVSDIQKKRRAQYHTSPVEEGEYVLDGDQVEQSAPVDQQHRPTRDHNDPLVEPNVDADDENESESESSSKADAVEELEHTEDDKQTVPDDQVIPKRQPQMIGTEGDEFQTPNIEQEEPPDSGGTAGGAFQTPSVTQQQETIEVAEELFQTPSVPQVQQQQTIEVAEDSFQTPNVQLPQNEDAERSQTPDVKPQTGTTAKESAFQTPSTGDAFATPYVQQETPPLRGNNGSGFSTPGATLMVDPDATFVADGSSSASWLNNPTDYFAFGAFVTFTVIAGVLLLVGRYHRWAFCRRRRKRRGTPWANEIKFHDEYESTDESTDDPEDFYNNYMVDSLRKDSPDSFGGSKSADWLGDMNFAVGEEDNQDDDAKSADNFDDFSQDEQSQSSMSYDSDGHGLSDILNGDNSNSNRGQSLRAPPSPPVSPLLNFAPDPENSLPTVSEVFRNNMSPHWENGKKPAPRFEEHSTFEELEREQGDLNQALFLINDQLLEQQRELKATDKALTQKSTRRKHRENTQKHKTITEEIARLESEKDDIDAKIRTVKTKLKAHRHDRRLKLFSNHE